MTWDTNTVNIDKILDIRYGDTDAGGPANLFDAVNPDDQVGAQPISMLASTFTAHRTQTVAFSRLCQKDGLSAGVD